MPETCRRVLVGFTDDAESVAAVAFAGRLAERAAAHLTVIAATAPHAYLLMSPHGAAAWQALPAALAERLRVSVQALPARIGVTHVLVEGNLAEALEDALGRESFDLLVLTPAAARGRGVRRLVRRTRVPLRVAHAEQLAEHDPGGAGRAASRRSGVGSRVVRQDERGP